MSMLGVLSVRYMDIIIISAPQKVVEDVHVSFKTTSIIEYITVDYGTPIFNEVHVSSDSTSDGVNEIVKSNIPAVSSKSFEFSCAEYSFMIIPTE